MSVGDLSLGTMIASAINFILLLVLLRRYAYRPLLHLLEARKEKVATNLAEAEADRLEAGRLRDEMKRQLAEAQKVARDILERAKRAATAAEEEILTRAREEAGRLLSTAREEIDSEKKKALRQIQQEVADLALTAADRILRNNLDTESGHALVRNFIAQQGRTQ